MVAKLDPGGVLDALSDLLLELEDRLDARLLALEQARHLGTFDPARQYKPGEQCSLNGSTWQAVRADPGKPAEGSGWALVAKAGSRGKTGPRGLDEEAIRNIVRSEIAVALRDLSLGRRAA